VAAYLWGTGGNRLDLITHTVRREKLQLTIVERGTLEAANNFDVVCGVKSGAKGSTVATTIKWVIDDGSHVMRDRPPQLRYSSIRNERVKLKVRDQKGMVVLDKNGKEREEEVNADLLAELDSSGLEEQAKAQKITVDQTEAAFIQAEEELKIVESQSISDEKKAETDLLLAKLDRQKYLPEKVAAELVARNVGMPASPLKLGVLLVPYLLSPDSVEKETDLGEYKATWNEIKGKVQTARSDLEMWRDRFAWSERMAQGKYISEAQKEADRNKLEVAILAVQKAEGELQILEKYTFKQKCAELNSKVEEAERALDRAKKQGDAKKVQAKANLSSKKSIFEQEKKRFEDLLEQIKNCKIYAEKEGLIVYYVPEQARWGGGSRQSLIAQGEPVSEGQKLMRIPDLQKMLVNTRVHEAMVSRVNPNQAVKVRVDAFPGRDLKARVDKVATVASQQDFLSSDVKVYVTMVEIEETLPGLKPGMSAEVTILTDSLAENALTIPIQAVLGTVELGRHRKCYVMTPSGPQEREIVVGISNEKMVEVKEGLEEGEQVVVNPRILLNEKERKTLGPEKGGAAKAGGPQEGKTGPGQGDPPAGPGTTANPGPAKTPDKPNVGPDGPKAGKPGKPKGSPGDRAKMMEEMLQRFRQATPEERKQMLDQIPEGFRDKVRQTLKGKGIDVPN
jgi:multidrug resistance efflux pump